MTFSLKNSPWFWAFFNVLILWAINNIVLGFCARVLGANPIIYSCSTFTISALMMLLIAGKGPLVKETLRSIDTWVYGFVLILGYILTFKLLTYVSATEGSLLQRTSMVISLLLSWFFLARKPGRPKVLGAIMVGSGVAWISLGLDDDFRLNVILLVIFSGLIQALRIFTAEGHRTHKQAIAMQDIRSRFRVIGFVMFIISLLFWALALIFASLEHLEAGITGLKSIPSLNDFRDPVSIFSGLITGALLLTPFRFIEFSVTSEIKTENYLAISSLAPIATLFWAWILGPALNLEVMTISSNVLYLSGALITLGAFIAALSGMRAQKEKNNFLALEYAAQDPERVDDSREVVAETLEHFNGDISKSAAALELPTNVLQALLDDAEKVLAFTPDVLKTTTRLYRKNVAQSDALTGLANRAQLMTYLKAAPNEAEAFSIIFIDLNKFKPVNDTYGHDAGDAVLKTVAERLHKIFSKQALCSRIGGDEFCVVLLNADAAAAKTHCAEIQTCIEQPITFGAHTFSVSASMGVAAYPADGTVPEALLKLADSSMYKDKESR